MPRRGENIYKRKDGRWEGRYLKPRLPGEKRQYGYVYAKSYREVRDKLRNAISVQKQSLASLSKEEVFGDIAEEWLQKKALEVKASTMARYHFLVVSDILPKWQNYKCRDITVDALQDFSAWLLVYGGARGMGVSAKTAADVLMVMKSILKYAMSKGYNIPCDLRGFSVKKPSAKLRVLSRMEQQKISEYLYSGKDCRDMGILICLFTGLRLGELCALRWDDINLEEGVIAVRHSMQRIASDRKETEKDKVNKLKTKIVIDTPKTACSLREIPLSNQLLTYLEKYPLPHRGYFLTGSEELYCEPRHMQRYFQKVLKNAGVEAVHFHTLRHTFATRCVELGFDVKSLSEILGHSNVNITMNRYVHPSTEFKRGHMKRLEGLMPAEDGQK